MEYEYFWSLHRVPNMMEATEFTLQNTKEQISLGRKQGVGNDKICNGPNVSRNHLKLIRSGCPDDWKTVRWSIVDLGGMVGTFLNLVKLEPGKPCELRCGDVIGVGCPEGRSIFKESGKETFVYRVKSPRAWSRGNVIKSLVTRELGIGRQSAGKDFQMLSELISHSSARQFQKMEGGPIISQGDIKYGDGKVILRNSTSKTMECYNIRNNKNNMVKLWSLPARPRWEDHLIEGGSLPPPYKAPLPLDAHKSRLTVLRSSNRLQRYTMDKGELKQDLFLSRKHRFTELSPDPENGWLVLNSVRVTKPSGRTCPGSLSGCNSTDVLKSFIIFENIPLKFLYHFEIKKSIFGTSIQDAAVCLGLLLVMHQNKSIEIFSMEGIIDHAENEMVELLHEDEEIVGFPINLKIVEKPPCLFEVKTNHHHLEMNMNPWLYIKSITEKQFSVHELFDDNPVVGGKIGNKTVDGVEHENVMFCPDDSARVIHFGSFGFKVLSIEKIENNGYSLREIFSLKSDDKERDKIKEQNIEVPITRVGRQVRRPVNYYDNTSETVASVTFHYEDELCVFGVLVSSETINDDDSQANSLMTHIKEVNIYDRNFKHIRTETLDEISVRSGMDLSSNVSLTLDQDLLLVSVKSSVRTTLHAYKLRSLVEIEEASVEECKPSNIERSQRRRSIRPRPDPRTLRRRSTWNERYDMTSTDDEEENIAQVEERPTEINSGRHRTRSGY